MPVGDARQPRVCGEGLIEVEVGGTGGGGGGGTPSRGSLPPSCRTWRPHPAGVAAPYSASSAWRARSDEPGRGRENVAPMSVRWGVLQLTSRLSKEVATTRPPEPSCLTSPAEKLKSPSPSTSSACEELYSPAALCRCRCRCGPPCGPSSPPPPLPPVSALPLAPGGVSPRRSGAAAPCLLPPGPRRFSTPARRFLSRLRSRFPICAMCREAAERENSWHAVRCPGGEFSGVVLLAETCVVT